MTTLKDKSIVFNTPDLIPIVCFKYDDVRDRILLLIKLEKYYDCELTGEEENKLIDYMDKEYNCNIGEDINTIVYKRIFGDFENDNLE